MNPRAPRIHPSHVDAIAPAARTSLAWLVASGAVALLAGCSTGSTNTLSGNNQPAATEDAAPPITQGWPDAGSTATNPGTGGGTGGGGVDASNPPGFDQSVFASDIQPILDTAAGKGCTAAGCHAAPNGIAGFSIVRQAAAGSADMTSNFNTVTALCNVAVPDQSVFYLKATTSHAGGASAVVSQAQASTILTWIQHASGAPVSTPTPPADGGAPTTGGDGGSSSTTASSLNLGVFTAEIQPILFGQLDYNVAPGTPVANNGCSRSTCHGSPSNPPNISPTNTPAQNLANFSNFVNTANPSASPILLCPLNDPGCPKSPHPGQTVFASQQDLNYQRIASWLYSAQNAASPLDFAFFARQIAPIFVDPASGGINGGQRTCADTTSCHGVQAAGQTPPNLSNFPILASQGSKQALLVNYWSASSFANFFNPQGSELFLFPTNLIANTVNQPFATGLAHPGGLDFAPNSAQAQAILQWASGLQPDANGNIFNFLVAGTYDATLVTQPTGVGNEATLNPQIFDPDGAQQFNAGQWDVLSSQNKFIDLNAEFPGAAGSGRVAYAVVNAINTTGNDIQLAQVTVQSPNAVLLYVGQSSSQGSLNGNNTVSLSTTLPAYATAKASTRILVKVLQRTADAQFGFSLNVVQQNNQPIPPGELVFRLDSTGGI